MVSIISLVFISLTIVGSVNAEECATAELLTIASNSNLEGCTSTVGFAGFSAISDLTSEQIKAVCDNSDCMALMDDMRAMGFGDCIVQGTNISLETDILDPLEKVCSGSMPSSSGEGTVGSSASDSSSTGSATIATATIALTVTTFLL